MEAKNLPNRRTRVSSIVTCIAMFSVHNLMVDIQIHIRLNACMYYTIISIYMYTYHLILFLILFLPTYHLILFLPTPLLNYTCLNAQSASSHPLATGPEPPTDYSLGN